MPKRLPDPRTIGGRIEIARTAKGLTRKEAAALAGFGEKYLYALEREDKGATLDRIYTIAIAWGVDPHGLDPRLSSTDSGGHAPSE